LREHGFSPTREAQLCLRSGRRKLWVRKVVGARASEEEKAQKSGGGKGTLVANKINKARDELKRVEGDLGN